MAEKASGVAEISKDVPFHNYTVGGRLISLKDEIMKLVVIYAVTHN